MCFFDREPAFSPRSCFFAASQERSFTLPALVVTTAGLTPAKRTIVATNTSSSPAGGFAMVLHSPRSCHGKAVQNDRKGGNKQTYIIFEEFHIKISSPSREAEWDGMG